MEYDMFTDETELCERSLRRLAKSKDCRLTRDGDNYTVFCRDEPVLTAGDDDTWAYLNSCVV